MSCPRVMAARGRVAGAMLLGLALWHPAWSAPAEAPAVIANASEQGRAELLATVRRALHDASVVLADDALTTSSTLIIERVPRRDSSGRLLNGRERGRPEQFQLRRTGRQCVLVHVNTADRWILRHAHCRVVP